MPTRALPAARPMHVALILLFAFSLLALPLPTLAAKGTDSRVEVSAGVLIAAVSPGETAAFTTSFTNNGPGTITSVRFEGKAAGGSFVPSAPCTGSGETVTCELGKFDAGHSVTLTLVFTAPQAGSVTFSGQFSGDAHSGNPKSSSKDVWSVLEQSVAIDTSPDFFGRWQSAHAGPKSFGPIGQVGSQRSQVTADPFTVAAYAATVRHSSQAISCTNASQLGGVDLAGFGHAVDMDIADGRTAVDVTITYPVGATNKPAQQIQVVHQHDDGSCTLLTAGCDGLGCFTASYEGHGQNKNLVIEAQLPHNGRIKGI